MRIPLILSLVLAASVGVDTASAQGPRAGRPYRGLFGGGVGEFTQLLGIHTSQDQQLVKVCIQQLSPFCDHVVSF